jgi:hypothetical protein
MTDGVVVTTNVAHYSVSGIIQGSVATTNNVEQFSTPGLITGVIVTTNAPHFSFSFNVIYGTVGTVKQRCSDTGAAVLIYYMTAWDADGAQYVYWETEDQYLSPATTQPAAVGTLTDFRIQAKRIA